jgi:hypothetical protein
VKWGLAEAYDENTRKRVKMIFFMSTPDKMSRPYTAKNAQRIRQWTSCVILILSNFLKDDRGKIVD